MPVRFIAAIAAAVSFSATPSYAQELVPSGQLGEIDWEAVERDAAAAGLESGRPQRSDGLTTFEDGGAAAANLTIPVLLPSSLVAAGRLNQLDQPLELIASRNAYSAEAANAPRSYVVQGTRVFFEDDGAAIDEQAAADLSINRLEYGVEVSFERYGAVYTVTIFCADPVRDPECAGDTRIRQLASEMSLAP